MDAGDPKLSILHLDCTLGRGGQERDHLNEALEFTRRGHSYWIGARPDSTLLSWAREQGVGIPFPLKSNFDLPSLLAIRRFILERKVDLLITTSYIDSVLGWLAARSLGEGCRPPVIRQRHLLNPPRNLFPYRHMCDYLVAVSDIARFAYIEKKIPFWKVISIPRGIPDPLEGNRPKPPGVLPALRESDRVVLQIGTFQRDKGQLPLMEHLLPHLRENPSLHLIILGNGPLRPNFEGKLDSRRFREVRDRIHCPGWVNPVPFYRRASVMVIPSIREAYPLVALESLFLGVPVVGFRQGGLPEIFDGACWGELVDPWNFPSLCRSAVRWAMRPEHETADLDTMRKIFRERFSIAVSAERSLTFYRWVLDRKKAGGRGNPYVSSGGAIDPFYHGPDMR